MKYLLNRNIVIGIIIILVLTFVFGMLLNLKDAYAYDSNLFDYINSWDTNSDGYNYILQCIINDYVAIDAFSYYPDIVLVFPSYASGGKAFSRSDGSYVGNYGWTGSHHFILTLDTLETAPTDFLFHYNLNKIIFSQINNTISFNNSNVMGKEIEIHHKDYTNSTGSIFSSIKFEIYDNNNNLIKVKTPDNISDSTILNLPYSKGQYYYINVVNPTIYQPYFYPIYTGIDFELPSMQLELGQAYKVISTDTTKSLTFSNQLPDQVYIYKEYIDGTYDIFNHSPSGSIPSLIETKDIIFMSTSSDVVETYFVIVDSIHHNHSVTTSSLDREDIIKVDSIPYVPEGVSEMWENLETGIPGIGDVDFKIDMGVESMDTSKDELLFENKSGQNMTLAFETSGSNVVFIPQKKMLDENMEYYWTDISVNSLNSDKVYTLGPNRRVIVQVYQGVLDFKYPLEYISGSQFIDYVHGVDYVLQVKYDAHGNNPTAEDGTGLINNPNSDISYTSPDDFNISDYFGDSTNNNISINNPYENVGIGGSIPTIPQVYDSISGIMSSAVAFVGIFTGIFNMFPAPLPAMFTLVVFSIPVFLFLKIVGR